MLVGSSCEDPRLVAEVQAPAQHPVPVLVPVVVMVDDPGETQRHVAEKRCVLDHVGVRFFDLIVHRERVVRLHVGRDQDLSRVLQHLEESFEHDVYDLVLLVDVVQLHQIFQRAQLILPLGLEQTLVDVQAGVVSQTVCVRVRRAEGSQRQDHRTHTLHGQQGGHTPCCREKQPD